MSILSLYNLGHNFADKTSARKSKLLVSQALLYVLLMQNSVPLFAHSLITYDRETATQFKVLQSCSYEMFHNLRDNLHLLRLNSINAIKHHHHHHHTIYRWAHRPLGLGCNLLPLLNPPMKRFLHFRKHDGTNPARSAKKRERKML